MIPDRLHLWLTRVAAAGYRTAQRLRLARAYRFEIREYAPTPSVWPEGQHLSIAVIADIHFPAGSLGPAELREIVKTANAAQPDLIVLLGDYGATHHIYAEHRAAMSEAAGILANLTPPLGVFAIMGNHDWWSDVDAQRSGTGPTAGQALADAGIRVLDNESVRLEIDGRAFWLAGLGDQLAFIGWQRVGGDDLEGTLAQVTDDAPILMLAHEPDIFVAMPDRVALTLSGHTHGGQVKVFGRTPFVPSRYGTRFVRGHVVEDGRHLIVSAGLGMSDLPFRVGVPPELLIIRLGGSVG